MTFGDDDDHDVDDDNNVDNRHDNDDDYDGDNGQQRLEIISYDIQSDLLFTSAVNNPWVRNVYFETTRFNLRAWGGIEHDVYDATKSFSFLLP
jgi:hypothetical protein